MRGDLILTPPEGDSSGEIPALPPVPELPEDPDLDLLQYQLDDRTLSDWLEEREELYSGYGSYEIYYEGFSQYGFFGESTFRLPDLNVIE